LEIRNVDALRDTIVVSCNASRNINVSRRILCYVKSCGESLFLFLGSWQLLNVNDTRWKMYPLLYKGFGKVLFFMVDKFCKTGLKRAIGDELFTIKRTAQSDMYFPGSQMKCFEEHAHYLGLGEAWKSSFSL
jgi:hypothetical protein